MENSGELLPKQRKDLGDAVSKEQRKEARTALSKPLRYFPTAPELKSSVTRCARDGPRDILSFRAMVLFLFIGLVLGFVNSLSCSSIDGFVYGSTCYVLPNRFFPSVRILIFFNIQLNALLPTLLFIQVVDVPLDVSFPEHFSRRNDPKSFYSSYDEWLVTSLSSTPGTAFRFEFESSSTLQIRLFDSGSNYNYYAIEYDWNDDCYELRKWVGGCCSGVGRLLVSRCGYPTRGTKWNITVFASEIRVEVDGEFVLGAADDSYRSGGLRLIGTTGDEVDNIVVTDLTGVLSQLPMYTFLDFRNFCKAQVHPASDLVHFESESHESSVLRSIYDPQLNYYGSPGLPPLAVGVTGILTDPSVDLATDPGSSYRWWSDGATTEDRSTYWQEGQPDGSQVCVVSLPGRYESGEWVAKGWRTSECETSSVIGSSRSFFIMCSVPVDDLTLEEPSNPISNVVCDDEDRQNPCWCFSSNSSSCPDFNSTYPCPFGLNSTQIQENRYYRFASTVAGAMCSGENGDCVEGSCVCSSPENSDPLACSEPPDSLSEDSEEEEEGDSEEDQVDCMLLGEEYCDVKKSDNNGVIVGAAVGGSIGGILLVVILAGIAYFVVLRRRRMDQKVHGQKGDSRVVFAYQSTEIEEHGGLLD